MHILYYITNFIHATLIKKQMRHSLDFFIKHAKHSATFIFLAGFFFDMFMLPNLDDLKARVIAVIYLSIIAISIMFREWVVSRNTASNFEQKIYSLNTLMISFSSGSMLSFIFIYSMRSAALFVSWPLLAILLLCILANEFVSTHSFRFNLDVGILLIAVLFYTIFSTPLVLKVQNDKIFALSIIIAMIISFIYIYFLSFTSENAKYEAPHGYALSIGIPMFVGMLYFLNVIPAVPLSLKESGVYHKITRLNDSTFLAESEKDERIFSNLRTSIYHTNATISDVYFFSSVGAPGELIAPLSHVWEYYDESSKKWIEQGTISFTIEGGRESGYRAYSYKKNIPEGLWRVIVKVDSKRIVGQKKFLVTKTEGPIKIENVDL